MNILYVGDVMGEVGMAVVETVLPNLKRTEHADLVIAQAENVTDGRGITVADFKRLLTAGVDFCTGGNWTTYRKDIYSALNDPLQPIIRPENYPPGTPGLGHKYIKSRYGDVLVISLLGHIVGRDADIQIDNPLQTIDRILAAEASRKRVATIVNFHGDYSSEKRIIGYYLDGQVSAVIGDHWHIPTADADVLPGGSAHITDVGMCGSLDSSLGVSLNSVIPRWRDGKQTKNVLERNGRRQFNALLVQLDETTGLAIAVRHIQLIE